MDIAELDLDDSVKADGGAIEAAEKSEVKKSMRKTNAEAKDL